MYGQAGHAWLLHVWEDVKTLSRGRRSHPSAWPVHSFCRVWSRTLLSWRKREAAAQVLATSSTAAQNARGEHNGLIQRGQSTTFGTVPVRAR